MVNGVTGSSGQTNTTTGNRFAELSTEDFMRVLFTELQNQDPLKPQDSSKMLEQLSSLRNIESQLTQQHVFALHAHARDQSDDLVVAIIEALHLFELAAAVGFLLLVDLRLLGVAFRNQPVARVLAPGRSPKLPRFTPPTRTSISAHPDTALNAAL